MIKGKRIFFNILLVFASILVFSILASASESFDWKAHSGERIEFLAVGGLEYAEGITSQIPAFEEKTGIKVDFFEVVEENYFDKVTTMLSSRSGQPDIIMTGAYQIWEYAPPGYFEDLTPYINSEKLTSPDYNFDDMYSSITDSLRWDCKIGHPVGNGGQWALPIGYEINCLGYNKDVFDKNNMSVPVTTDDLLEAAKALQGFEGPGTYGIAVRGTRNWATIHPAYMSVYSSFGAKDFEVKDGKMVSCFDSKEAIEATDYFVKLIKEGGTPQWSTYTWIDCQQDFGARKAAICYDCDTTYIYMNYPGGSPEAGNLAYCNGPIPPGKEKALSNLWVWALAMNSFSENKDAAWYFIQYFTSPDYGKWTIEKRYCIDPPRQSTFEDPAFKELIATQYGFEEMFEEMVDNTKLLFTPNPHFFEVTTEWAATLQDIVGGKYKSTEEGMKALKTKVDEIMSDLDVEGQ